jgi:hypothetical protein
VFRTVLFSAIIGLLAGCDLTGECSHEISPAIPSPDEKLVAAIDIVNCGVTTGYVSWVLVAPQGQPIDPERHRVAVYEGQLEKVRWVGERDLEVKGAAERVDTAANGHGVTIRP